MEHHATLSAGIARRCAATATRAWARKTPHSSRERLVIGVGAALSLEASNSTRGGRRAFYARRGDTPAMRASGVGPRVAPTRAVAARAAGGAPARCCPGGPGHARTARHLQLRRRSWRRQRRSPARIASASWFPRRRTASMPEQPARGHALSLAPVATLSRYVGARSWGPGRYGAALREAVASGRARRVGRSSFAPTRTERDRPR
jgi:hypothetical protein